MRILLFCQINTRVVRFYYKNYEWKMKLAIADLSLWVIIKEEIKHEANINEQ